MRSESIGFLYKFITPKFHEVGGSNFHFFSHPTSDAFYFFFLFSLKIRKLFCFCIFPNKSGMIMKPLHYLKFFFSQMENPLLLLLLLFLVACIQRYLHFFRRDIVPLKGKKKNSEVVDCLV